jgi:hypothetical protein
MDDGHCGFPRDDLIRSGAKLLEVAEPLIERALQGELASGEVIAGVTEGREVMFLAGLYRAEQSIANRLLRLREGRLPWPAIDAAASIALGREQHGSGAFTQPAGGDASRARVEDLRDHRRAGCRQDHARQFHPQDAPPSGS